jgi:hypothetical protein
MGRIVGGSAAGISYPQGSGTPTVGPASATRVTGSPPLSQAVGYDDSYETVFGMTFSELRSIATTVITDPGAIPTPMPTAGIVIIDAGNNVQFDATTPLTGNALVVVRGNVVIAVNSNSNFAGLLYVEGNLTVRQPSLIRGAVVCTGSLTVQGATEYATIQFDQGVLDGLMSAVSNYTPSNAPLLPRLAR